ncbi:hypothetical protein RJ641_002730 [Dillenia turbinata]|uniref:Mannan endo-1,4-beta-mannosidase n=1 Tax=Dillenia turbinata TaxID=194707 RepID=A0AAN8VK70_9MAGN
MVAKGLSKQPLDAISQRIASLGFNCVRLTWAVGMVVTDAGKVTVRQALQNLKLTDDIVGFGDKNPSLLDVPRVDAFVTWNMGKSKDNAYLGAEAVHEGNPNLLVILSGLNYDLDLSFIKDRPVSLSFSNKLVYGLHWSSWSGAIWDRGDPAVCDEVTGGRMNDGGCLMDKGFPLILSEFGMDQRNTNPRDNKYIGCTLRWLHDKDVDWAVWGLQGSYYFREGVAGTDEVFGVLSYDWSDVRNNKFMDSVKSIMPPRTDNITFLTSDLRLYVFCA